LKTALITGITGQDGSYLAEFLLEKGYEVHGVMRRASTFNTGRIEHLYFDEWIKDMHAKKKLELHYGDMTDSSSLLRIIQLVKPDELYNLAAQSHVKVSFEVPEYTAESDAIGTLRILEAVRILGLGKKSKSIRPPLPSSMVKCRKSPNQKLPLFIPVHLMELQSNMVFGLQKITVKLMAFLPSTESCLITKASEEERLLLPGKLLWQLAEFNKFYKNTVIKRLKTDVILSASPTKSFRRGVEGQNSEIKIQIENWGSGKPKQEYAGFCL